MYLAAIYVHRPISYMTNQDIRGGKLSRLEQKWTFNGKTFAVEASCNNECLV